ncbi:zinc ABC transporter substrate-binding protein [Notoacmeibacter marinus]|nr:zinc ABC transporter substrate-binding protein [Notoacmeibacter marinus]
MSSHSFLSSISVAALVAALGLSSQSAIAEEGPKVIVSFTPIHSLAASIMDGVGEPELLVPPSASPHGFALKPSQAGSMQEADLIIRIGPELESFLDKPIATLGDDARILDLMEAEGVEHLPTRKAGLFDDAEDHDHDHKDQDGHDDHEDHDDKEAGHEDGHDHAREDGHEHAHDDGDAHDAGEASGHHDHDHGPEDPHIWLDPDNAKAIVNAIAGDLAAVDPDHADRYRENAEATIRSIDDMEARIEESLGPVKEKSFVTFHDAFQYFEHAFGLNGLGSLTISPEIAPGAKRLKELADEMTSHKVACILVEPQFSPKLSQTLAEQTGAQIAELDPAGAIVEPGAGAYEALMVANAQSLADCLSGKPADKN